MTSQSAATKPKIDNSEQIKLLLRDLVAALNGADGNREWCGRVRVETTWHEGELTEWTVVPERRNRKRRG